MYSDSDLDAAAQAGILPAETVLALRRYVAEQRTSNPPDEEHFRLLTGFNDIFVAIAIVILLVAMGWIGNALSPLGEPPFVSPAGGLLVAGTSWGLAEYFTRQRRMALPSIILLLGFVYGIWSSLFEIATSLEPDVDKRGMSLVFSVMAVATAGMTWLHWKRFGVPITIAALASALVGTLCGVLIAAFPILESYAYGPILLCGLAVFAFAMQWDVSDRERITRRTDVAFWLHLLAAPLIAHSLFNLLGVFDADLSTGAAVTVLALYLLFAAVALAIDRRALLVSSLAYVLYALYQLFQRAGAIELGAALTALVIGSALLVLSAFWAVARTAIVTRLPSSLAEKLRSLAPSGRAATA
jgi:hypothetical protein